MSFGRKEVITFSIIAVLVIFIIFTTSSSDPFYHTLLYSSLSSSAPNQQSSLKQTSTNIKNDDSIDQQQQQQQGNFGDVDDLLSSSSLSSSNPNSKSNNVAANNNINNNKPHVVNPLRSPSSSVTRPFKFHIYKLPRQYVEGAIEALQQNWHVSICNRGSKKSNYTMLDWRHAHSLFTADVFITRYMRLHPQHTDNPDEADAFIIPMMSHLYNCAGKMGYQIDILSMILSKYNKNYKEMEHRDHYLFWWRWGMHYGSVQRFWKRVTKFFPNVNLISFDLLEIMGRNGYQDFSLALKPKFDRNLLNIVMPYPDFSPLLSVEPVSAKEIHERERKILFYFAGTSTIGGVRRWIKWNCDKHRPVSAAKSEVGGGGGVSAHLSQQQQECVYVDFATSVTDLSRLGVPKDYPRAMKDSVFCGHAAGDALSSRRPTSAVLAGCIPVLICDLCLYAWEGQIDYSAFSIFVPESEVISGNLMSILKKAYANSTYIHMLRDNLNLVRGHFVYHEGSPREGDALDMLAKELERRGALMRQYRRWFQMNGALSSDIKDYPVEPPAVKKYVRRDPVSGAIDQKDAQMFPSRPLPVA